MISHAPRGMTECYVTARLYGGTYLATVDKTRISASCTSDIETAARRAAGKHLRVREDRVVLRAIPTNVHARARFEATIGDPVELRENAALDRDVERAIAMINRSEPSRPSQPSRDTLRKKGSR